MRHYTYRVTADDNKAAGGLSPKTDSVVGRFNSGAYTGSSAAEQGTFNPHDVGSNPTLCTRLPETVKLIVHDDFGRTRKLE